MDNKLKRNITRMLPWLVIGLLCYFVTYCLAGNEQLRQFSTVSWKLGNVTVSAYVGYWIDRHLFARIDETSQPLIHIRRAIIVGAVVLAVAMGL